jgi:hypothetical protein
LTGVSVGSGQMLLVKVNKQGQVIQQRSIPWSLELDEIQFD